MPESLNSTGTVREITLFDLALILVRRRRWIGWAVACGIAVGLLIAFLSPVVYEASSRIVPSAALAPTGDLGTLSQFRAAASQFGFDVGMAASNPSPLFPQLLEARDLQRRILDRHFPTRDGRTLKLAAAMKLERATPEATAEAAGRFLDHAVHSSYDLKTGVTTIAMTSRDPVLAAAVVNAFVEELNGFMNTLRSGQAGEKVRFISQRLVEVQTSLDEAEAKLTDFRLKNRQTSDSPVLMQEEARLLREVTLNEQVFVTLKTQLEIARIDQFRDLPDVMVMDKAYAPLHKSAPHRAKILVYSTLFFGFLGLVLAFAREAVDHWNFPARPRPAGRGAGAA